MQLDAQAEQRAEVASKAARRHLQMSDADTPEVAIIFTSGLDQHVKWDDDAPMGVDLHELPGFEALKTNAYPTIKGHARHLLWGTVNGIKVLGLRGRLHLYEGKDEELTRGLVRLMVDMLIHMGAKVVISTSIVGSCVRPLRIGQVGIATGFLSSGRRMTSIGAEGYPTLEHALDQDLVTACLDEDTYGFRAAQVVHFLWESSTIEGPAQKRAVERLGGHVISCSGQPELEAVARHHRASQSNVTGLVVGFVSNGDEHDNSQVHDAVAKYGKVWMDDLFAAITLWRS